MPEERVRLIDANALAVSDMAKLIDRYLYNQCNLTVGLAAALMPTIEAGPVRHGRWDEIQCFTEHGIPMASYECTNCGNDIERQRGVVPAYCEFCGAKMDGGAEN